AGLLRADYARLAAATGRATSAEPALASEAVERFGELSDEAARLGAPHQSGDSLKLEAGRIADRGQAPLPGALWRAVFAQAQGGIQREYGRLSAGADTGGTSLAAAGNFVGQMAGKVFGINEYLDRVEIAPQLAGIADDQVWSIDGWLLSGGDTLGMIYRPADHAVTLRLSAGPRRRFSVRFPWVTAASCVSVRRGSETERINLIGQTDGSWFFDVRGTFDPAVITLSASACGS
ncbi:MAG TPA: hypothetical protein VGI92_09070, partial [Gemmatimonadales bacterium]